MIAMYNHDDERYLIGALLQDADLQRQLPAFPDDLMHDPQHEDILRTMKAMQAEKQPIEVLSLSNRMIREQKTAGSGAADYLIECCRYCPTTANIRHYLDELKHLRALRAAYRMANTFCHRLNDGEDLTGCVDELRRQLREANQPKGQVLTMADVMKTTFDYIEAKSKGEITGISTGIPDYDRYTGGLFAGELTVIGARPGEGKSALGMAVSEHVAHGGKQVFICSREMNDLQFGLRMTSSASGINGMTLRSGQVGDNQWELLGGTMNELSRLPIAFTFDTPTIEELRNVVAHQADTCGIDLLVADYLQMIKTMKRREKRYQEVGDVSRGLKEIALEFKIPVIALAQVGRMKDSGGTKRAAVCPVMSDLRESGNIEQDADNILFLHHPETPDDPVIPERDRLIRERIEAAGQRYTIGNIVKQRMGPIGRFGMAFNPDRMRYTGLETQ